MRLTGGNFILIDSPAARSVLTEALSLSFVGWGCCTANYFWAPDTRNCYLLHYVTQGCGTVFLNGVTYPVKAGDTFYMSPSVSGSYRADKDDPFACAYFAFHGSEAADMASRLVISVQNPVVTGYGEELYTLCREFAVQYPNEGGKDLLSWEYLCRMLRLFVSNVDANATCESAYIHSAQAYIRLHYNETMTVGTLAEALHVSRSHLSRLYKAATGESLHEHLLNFRLSKAKEALLYSPLPVKLVAQSCGFEHYSSFYREFVAHEQLSPLEWRKQRTLAGNKSSPASQPSEALCT